MKRLALLFLSLLLLCGCAPQMGEESPLTPLDEPKSEAEGSESISEEETLPLNQKILLDFDSREDFSTDSVRVTLKASASDHLDPPTAEDFPGIDLSRIEYLITGGYDIEKGKDWDTYFSVPERKPEYFRWRLRLYFEEPGEETARDAVDVLNKMPEVAEIENANVYPLMDLSPYLSRDGEYYYKDRLYVSVKSDYSDPNVPYDLSDLGALPEGVTAEVRWPNHPVVTPIVENGFNSYHWGKKGLFSPDEIAEYRWTIRLFFPDFSQEEVARWAGRLQQKEDVRYVGYQSRYSELSFEEYPPISRPAQTEDGKQTRLEILPNDWCGYLRSDKRVFARIRDELILSLDPLHEKSTPYTKEDFPGVPITELFDSDQGVEQEANRRIYLTLPVCADDELEAYMHYLYQREDVRDVGFGYLFVFFD